MTGLFAICPLTWHVNATSWLVNDRHLVYFLLAKLTCSTLAWHQYETVLKTLFPTCHNPYCLVWIPVVVLCASKSKALCGGFTKQSRSPTDCHLLQYNVLWPKWGRDYTVYTIAAMWCMCLNALWLCKCYNKDIPAVKTVNTFSAFEQGRVQAMWFSHFCC